MPPARRQRMHRPTRLPRPTGALFAGAIPAEAPEPHAEPDPNPAVDHHGDASPGTFLPDSDASGAPIPDDTIPKDISPDDHLADNDTPVEDAHSEPPLNDAGTNEAGTDDTGLNEDIPKEPPIVPAP